MEMHQVRYFLALCETLNFTRAAERCNVTQPSLTRAIKLLEDEFGGPLFNRERNQTHLTELGRLTAPHLREVFDQAHSARARAASFLALRSAKLKLGVAHGLTLSVLDDTVRRFVLAHPATELLVLDDHAAELREALRRGDFEIVMLPHRSPEPDDLHHYVLRREPVVAIMAAAHELARLPEIPLGALAGAGVVCGDGCPFWGLVEQSLAEHGFQVTPKAVVSRIEWVFELVGMGVGVGVCASRPRLPPGLVGRPIAGAAVTCEITLTTKRGRLYSPPVKAFVDLALQVAPGRAALTASAA